MPFAPGEYVGPYRIIEQLGHGGMATVWKAYHAPLDRDVAIKVLHPVFVDDAAFLERFHKEAKIVARLVHPHIVPVYDFSEEGGLPYLVMRYIEGETLKTVLRRGPLPLRRIVKVLRPAGEALAYAHGQGVLHRDIKPSNIMETPEGEVLLADFGLARMMEDVDGAFSREVMVGTPQYISPEQARGEELDRGTDIYSLGVVLFEMLTGRVPFEGDTAQAIIRGQIFSPPPRPSQFVPTIPEVVERVVLKALAKERGDRYRSVEEMMAALGSAAQETGFPSPERPLVAPSLMVAETVSELPLGRRRRFPWLILTLLLLLLCSCSTLLWFLWRG
jgi:serine/threonine-protein kinase